MQVCLDRSEGTIHLACDLFEREVAEESQDDDLSIRLRERGNRGTDIRSALGPRSQHGGIRLSARADGRGRNGCGGRVCHRAISDRLHVNPGHGLSATRLSNCDANRDPREPGPKRPFAAPARERAIRGHKGLLRSIFSVVKVAEDPMTGPDNGSGFAIDKMAEGLTIAGENRIDDGTVIGEPGRPGRGSHMGFENFAAPLDASLGGQDDRGAVDP